MQKGTWRSPLLITIAYRWCWWAARQICDCIWWWRRLTGIDARITAMQLITKRWISTLILIAQMMLINKTSEYKTLSVSFTTWRILITQRKLYWFATICVLVFGLENLTWLGQTCNNGKEQAGLLYAGLNWICCNFWPFNWVGLSAPVDSSDEVAFGERQNFFSRDSCRFSGFYCQWMNSAQWTYISIKISLNFGYI